MHIGISALHVRPGKSGSHEPYMVNLVHALAELESAHHFSVFGTQANRELFFMDRKGFEFIEMSRVTERVIPRIFFEQFVLPVEAVRRKIHVVHYGGTAGSCLIRPSDVVTVHHDSVTQRASMSAVRNFYFDVVLRLNRRAGFLIVPSNVYGKEMIGHYGYRTGQMRAIHHGTHSVFVPQSQAEISEARRKWGIRENSVLSITNTLPHKNVHNLVAAFDRLTKRFRVDAQLVLVGNVDQQVVNRIAAAIAQPPDQLLQNIRLIPFLTSKELPPIYCSAKIFTFVSLTETFGMPLTEAMACGVPIIASDIPVHREILDGAGRLVNPADPSEIAVAMHELLTDTARREDLKRASVKRGRCFSWHETARRTLAVYEEAARR